MLPTRFNNNISGLDTIVDNLKIDVVNGFKGVAALSNLLNSTTETHGNLQVDFFVSAINSLQDEDWQRVCTEYFDIGNQGAGHSKRDCFFNSKGSGHTIGNNLQSLSRRKPRLCLAKLEAGVISVAEARTRNRLI